MQTFADIRSRFMKRKDSQMHVSDAIKKLLFDRSHKSARFKFNTICIQCPKFIWALQTTQDLFRHQRMSADIGRCFVTLVECLQTFQTFKDIKHKTSIDNWASVCKIRFFLQWPSAVLIHQIRLNHTTNPQPSGVWIGMTPKTDPHLWHSELTKLQQFNVKPTFTANQFSQLLRDVAIFSPCHLAWPCSMHWLSLAHVPHRLPLWPPQHSLLPWTPAASLTEKTKKTCFNCAAVPWPQPKNFPPMEQQNCTLASLIRDPLVTESLAIQAPRSECATGRKPIFSLLQWGKSQTTIETLWWLQNCQQKHQRCCHFCSCHRWPQSWFALWRWPRPKSVRFSNDFKRGFLIGAVLHFFVGPHHPKRIAFSKNAVFSTEPKMSHWNPCQNLLMRSHTESRWKRRLSIASSRWEDMGRSLACSTAHVTLGLKLHLPGMRDERSEEVSRLAVPHNKVTIQHAQLLHPSRWREATLKIELLWSTMPDHCASVE